MKNKKRKICIASGYRATYSHAATVIRELQKRDDIEVLFVAHGAHILGDFGRTADALSKEGVRISHVIESYFKPKGIYSAMDKLGLKRFISKNADKSFLRDSTPFMMAKYVGHLTHQLAEYFEKEKPDIVIALMDRFEDLATGVAAALSNRFLAHIEGGEVTGTIDESVRHALTKFANIHFVSNGKARERVIKMGEPADTVFNTGSPASDLIFETPELSKEETLKESKKYAEFGEIDLSKPYILITYHPVTTEFGGAYDGMLSILEAVKDRPEQIFFFRSNIDAGAKDARAAVKDFLNKHKPKNFVKFLHTPPDLFINLERNASLMLGNSSAGVREACYFGLPVVNVGTRQSGRDRAKNVADVPENAEEIKNAVSRQIEHGSYDSEYLYGESEAGKKIAEILATCDTSKIQKRLTY